MTAQQAQDKIARLEAAAASYEQTGFIEAAHNYRAKAAALRHQYELQTGAPQQVFELPGAPLNVIYFAGKLFVNGEEVFDVDETLNRVVDEAFPGWSNLLGKLKTLF